ncbi:polyamine ABC transporter ATP-binding protein [Phenylobacterium soli]|uniref:Polyamine ABC transporter ATP-binding protein n=1 Tax=Phenylobacterium soli TaxID=2170551 RepID=A0A328AP15_9CAUL|nr:polyamine ABC transporter ATP-binding protein [Phenylobacterium soli]
MTPPPLVRFEGVTKRFGAEAAVRDVTLDIGEGEFFALLGPSGCGKTTLMRLLAGFETPDAGRILLAGQDIAGLPPHRRPVHMMFQAYALFPHLTVAQNIGFGLKAQGAPRARIAARVDEMLTLVKLEGLGGRKPDQLSGGQKQRVALARALAPEPKILLLDEPMAALDRKLREETQFELKSLQARLGLTFLIVTHDQDEAMLTADRLAVMRAGEIVQVGTPAEVYERPADRFVAGFLGQVNLFETPQGWIGVRPERIRLAPEPAAGAFQGTVLEVGYLGDRTVYVAQTAPGRTVLVAQSNVGGGPAARVGDTVWLSYPPEAAAVLAS